MKTTLHVSPDLRLPLDLITETAAIIAKRGVGKTYAASVITEELLKARNGKQIPPPAGKKAWRLLVKIRKYK